MPRTLSFSWIQPELDLQTADVAWKGPDSVNHVVVAAAFAEVAGPGQDRSMGSRHIVARENIAGAAVVDAAAGAEDMAVLAVRR